jgi:predicted metal-binding protein
VIDLDTLKKLALDHGFSQAALLDCSTIELRPEVREMCQSGNCHMYGKCWSCPPHCGTLEECRARVANYRQGLLVQTIGELEDEFDGESMLETEALHKQHFDELERVLRSQYPQMLAMGAGCCRKCRTCTCPDAPCRFPAEAFSSMEAYGMLVAQVCQANHLDYYYGPNTIAYTSCYLLERAGDTGKDHIQE